MGSVVTQKIGSYQELNPTSHHQNQKGKKQAHKLINETLNDQTLKEIFCQTDLYLVCLQKRMFLKTN